MFEARVLDCARIAPSARGLEREFGHFFSYRREKDAREPKTVQRTGASRFAQGETERHRRLAPVADLAFAIICTHEAHITIICFSVVPLRVFARRRVGRLR